MTVTLENMTRTVDGIPTIRNVSLTLERGTLSVLLGPTLSGKTSIMRLLAGLDKPATGRVLVDGKDVTGFDVRQRSVAMVYQQFINYPSLTVYENIASPLRVQGKPRAEIDKRVQEAARLLKLEPYLNRTPLQLSGGQQQRTAIARALVKGADLVLLDEPLANLDYKLKSIAIPTPCASPRCFPIRRSTSSGSKSATARCSMPAACRRRRPDFMQGLATAPTGSASAPTSSRSPTALPGATPFTPP